MSYKVGLMLIKRKLNFHRVNGLWQNTHVPAKSCCISVNAEVSFLSRCSRVFLVSAFSCKRMRISSSTSRTWKELSGQWAWWEHENFFYYLEHGAFNWWLCYRPGPVGQKPISANPGLNIVIRVINCIPLLDFVPESTIWLTLISDNLTNMAN